MSDAPRYRPATVAVHAPAVLPPVGAAGERAVVPPLYQNLAWQVDDAAANDAVAEGQGYFYQRYGAPNADGAAAAVALLEGAEAGMCFASGMAALSAVLTTWVRPGRALVTVRGIYGGTVGLVAEMAERAGIEVRWADTPRPEAIAPLLDGAALVHVETLSNPLLRVADLDGLGALCESRGVPLSVDATFTTPILSRPLGRGATLTIHSASKYLGGHGDVCAGVVCGARAEVERLVPVLKLHGATLDPFAAWLLGRGLRTLEVRMRRQVENAGRVAASLAAHPSVARVHYPGLASHPDRALAAAQLDGFGAMVSFEVRDAGDPAAAAHRVYDRLRLVGRVASLGDVASTVMHPPSSSHRAMPKAERERAGIRDGLLRVSVGIEDAEDLIADLAQALD